MVSLRQRITPERLLGRLSGAFRLVSWGTKPLGAAAGGLVAQLCGLRAVFVANRASAATSGHDSASTRGRSSS